MDCTDGVVSGRPRGSTAILWSKALNASIFYNDDKSIIGLKLSVSATDLCFINAYLPYCCSTNIDKFLLYLGALEAMYKFLNCPNIAILGDFNASDSISFGKLLNDFCCNNNFKLSNKFFMPSDSFTYCSEAHSTTSWLDHCLSFHSLHSLIECMEILYGYISSDHHPLAVNFNICLQTQFVNVGKSYSTFLSLNWDVSSDSKYGYFLESGKLLSDIDLPIDAIQCESIKCNNPNRLKDINTFYDNIIESLITATYHAIPVGGGTSSIGKAVASGYSLIPGWNKAV